jgi:hypothetical protein
MNVLGAKGDFLGQQFCLVSTRYDFCPKRLPFFSIEVVKFVLALSIACFAASSSVLPVIVVSY